MPQCFDKYKAWFSARMSPYISQRKITGERIGRGAKRQRDAEGEEKVDEHGLSSSISRKKMLHHLGKVEGFVAGKKDHDSAMNRPLGFILLNHTT